MRSIADDLRSDLRQEQAARSATERLRTSFELGDTDARLLASARGIDAERARRLLQWQRERSRRPSVCHRALLS